MSDTELQEWAESLCRDAIVIDGHCDTVLWMLDAGYDISVRNEEHQIDIPRLLETGVDCQFFACWAEPDAFQGREIQRSLDLVETVCEAAESDDRIVIAESADDILNAKKEGKTACLLDVEGGHSIANDIRVLRVYYRLGVRSMTLTWNNNLDWADASNPDQSRFGNKPLKGGLTDFGREVVREMNLLGMLVDISHAHDDTFWDVIETSGKPIIASHSCAYALNPHHRNLKDDQLRAIASNGGVVGLNYFTPFISKEYAEALPARETFEELFREIEMRFAGDPERQYRERVKRLQKLDAGLPKVTVSDLVDHVDHVVNIAGIEHVGLGSDFDGLRLLPPQGLEDITGINNIVVEMRKRGYGEAEIRKCLGENFLRVIRAALE